MLLGVHCSSSGGIYHACQEAASLKTNTFQVFTKNQHQWKEKEFSSEEVTQFKDEFRKGGIRLAFSHASYLINLAHATEWGRRQAVDALIGEVNRCHALGLAFTVLHPGFPKELGASQGIRFVARGLKRALAETSHSRVKILAENMAGQGSALGGPFEQLHDILSAVGDERVACCFDTCHAFAAGYDIRTVAGFDDCLAKWEKVIGLSHMQCIHLNDSKGHLGSHLDRHEHIGEGQIGTEPFKAIMQRFPHLPKVLETPKENNGDVKNLKALREFA